MKRQAAKQLSKDGRDDESEEEDPGQGFKRADEAVLATRVIRGLPKRAGGATPVTARVHDAPKTAVPSLFPSNPLGGAGPFKFDASSTTAPNPPSSSPFTGFPFKPTADTSSKTSAPAPAPAPAANNIFSLSSKSAFAPTPFQPASSTTNPFSSGPSQTSNTSKAFASLLNNTGSSSGPTPTAPPPAVLTPSPSATTTNGAANSNLEKYYTELRGLNTSLLSSISKGVESDPFIDMSPFLEKYQTYRSKIQKEFDESSTTSNSKSTESSASKLTPPVPPTSFAGFGLPKKPTSTPTSSDSKPSKPNIFDFKTTASSPAPNPFAPAKDSQPATSPFGASTFPAAAPSSTTSPSPFAFGSSSKLGTGSSPFGTFGSPAPSSGFNIGGSSTSSAGSKSVFGSSGSPFTFGASADKPAASANIFGGADKLASPFQTASKDTPKSVFGSSAFGTKVATESSATTTATATEEKSTEGETSESGTPAAGAGAEGADPSVANLIASGPNPHDEEGEGEENEETSHSVKAKAYRLGKSDDGGVKWITLGSGILRLKKDKDTGARRVLLRNSTNGKVIMNFNIYSGLKPTQTKSAISFVGHDAGTSQTYSVRLGKEEDAAELKSALEREIEFVKAKE